MRTVKKFLVRPFRTKPTGSLHTQNMRYDSQRRIQ